ncbi:MAG: YceI family protein [Bacteroidota bacterium]|jgi:polyisoprenoid-binding protein YceI|nr:YceI family protein [Bacteroidota bacterium]MCA6442291.1 YceI family protein [Bacteroidota bacterium]
MKKLVLGIAVLASLSASAQVNWKLDNSHSKLGFSVTHMMVSETEGKFKIYQGTVASTTETDFTDAKIEFTADVNSINTEDEKRDGHLKSPDFFDAAKFPTITFKSTSMKPVAKGKTIYNLEGELTMHGVTKKVKLNAIGATKTVKDPYGNIKYGFKVTGVINRKDFGLSWNAALEAGGVAVSEDVKLDLNIELNKDK